MHGNTAVVFDMAGTMYRMYRVAKDMERGALMEGVVTFDLVMERERRALVIPNLDPSKISAAPPDRPLGCILRGRGDSIDISYRSGPVSREEAVRILKTTRARIADIQEPHRAVVTRCPTSYQTTGLIVDAGIGEVSHTLSTGGTPFPGLDGVLSCLQEMGADVYVASGDSMRSLSRLFDHGIEKEHIFPSASPEGKRDAVLSLRKIYDHVVMVGDGPNDALAFKAADMGVLTVQQSRRPAHNISIMADVWIKDIRDLPALLQDADIKPRV